MIWVSVSTWQPQAASDPKHIHIFALWIHVTKRGTGLGWNTQLWNRETGFWRSEEEAPQAGPLLRGKEDLKSFNLYPHSLAHVVGRRYDEFITSDGQSLEVFQRWHFHLQKGSRGDIWINYIEYIHIYRGFCHAPEPAIVITSIKPDFHRYSRSGEGKRPN